MYINKIRFRNILTAVFLLAFSLISFALNIYDFKNAKDPKHDLAEAIKSRDFRFYAVNGFASGMVPGTDQWGVDTDIIKLYGTQTIAGTTDGGPIEVIELSQRACAYATTYNELLLKYLRSSDDKKPITRQPE